MPWNKTLLACWLLACGTAMPAAHAEDSTRRGGEEPVMATGRQDPRLAPLDRLMTSFLAEHEVPGGALAVTRAGRLVYARGFGQADLERGEAVEPTSLFRIASLSKPLTAVAVLQLVERGKLDLGDGAFELLDVEPYLADGAEPDPRLGRITVRHLLQHTGGWDAAETFDPMFCSVRIARALGVEPPARQEHIIRYTAGQPLQSEPGQRTAYSNFGYCLLGRIIEAACGQPYEAAVRQHVLAPLGIEDMRIGRTLLAGRAEGEVTYCAGDGSKGPAVLGPELGQPVPRPYGAWYLEGFDSHGGWIGSAVDLVRFAAEFDEPSRSVLLGPASVRRMFAPPPGPPGRKPDGSPATCYYACGWRVRRVGEGLNAWHMGRISGTAALLVRRHDGLDWAVLFNRDAGPGGEFLAEAIDPLVHRAVDAVEEWPDDDLFPCYGLRPAGAGPSEEP